MSSLNKDKDGEEDSMYIPNPYFKNIPQMGDLILDYIFLENGYPVLFTCKNKKNNNLYLCVCRTVIGKQKWTISEISVKTLDDMINNRITIHDAFKTDKKYSCIAIWSKDSLAEDYTVIKSSKLLDFNLPDNDVYLDDDDQGTVSYLQNVKNR